MSDLVGNNASAQLDPRRAQARSARARGSLGLRTCRGKAGSSASSLVVEFRDQRAV